MKRDYFEGADVAVTICAKDGTILDMNQKSRRTFLKPGLEEIIGQNVPDGLPGLSVLRHAGGLALMTIIILAIIQFFSVIVVGSLESIG